SIAGCVYRVVQTTEPDGKNLLKLIPVSKSSGSFVPIVQSSAMSGNSKANISSPLNAALKTQLATATAPSLVSPGKIFLARTLENQDSVRTGSEIKSVITKSAANNPSGCVSVDRLSLQNIAVMSSPKQNNTMYTILNTRSHPVNVKSPVLPLGHHIQIPADAEVKSVPASFLPAVIQQKILAAATTSLSEGAESAKTPTVIYVSPVNTVKTALPKSLPPGHPQPATEVSKALIVTPTQKGSSSFAEAGTSGGQQSQQTPIQWIVQETPQTPPPRLIPVKSSNNMASKILKALSDVNTVKGSPTNILPACSSSAGGSQAKITSLKGNSLVMHNGKVYLLTKRGFGVVSAQADKLPPSPSDASLKQNEMPKPTISTEINKITNQVVNLVLSKSKGVLCNVGSNSNNSSTVGIGNGLEPAPTALATPSANQQSPVHQKPFTESRSSGVTAVAAVGPQESVCQNSREASHSPAAASAVFPQCEQECESSEDLQKIKREKMDSPAKVIKINHQEKMPLKQDMELRKKFGLFKEERVYVKKMPSCTRYVEPEKKGFANNSLRKENGSCSSSPLDAKITNRRWERAKGEKVIVSLGEFLTKKRKRKSAPLTESGKRRRTKSNANLISENTVSASSVLTRSVSPPPVSPQPSISTDVVVPSVEEESAQDPCTQCSDNQEPALPVVVSCEGNASIFDASPLPPPDLDETVRDEKIKRLKQLLREREVALEEIRRK
ncbi:LRIF1 factor, partial [Upupa epops]|nr:LRIF1 factor [Upupa epops]